MSQIDEGQIALAFDIVDDVVKILNEVGLEGKPRTIEGLLDSLKYIRVLARYTVFDLEATYRERDCLRRIIDGGTK